MSTEVIYEDGSMSSFDRNGGAAHFGGVAINRLRLITAIQALRLYIKTEGRMQLTANGTTLAIRNVIEPATGKTYKRSMNGKREALADAEALLAAIEGSAVIYKEEE